uniref:NADH-cytochrome b5 reductase n=1 Tax=Cucumis sativus TaxID=3659 RepID=A0A0A0LF54_CUCSA
MATFLRRLANAAPSLRYNALLGTQSKIHSSNFRFPIGAIAAASGGISYLYYVSYSDLVHLDQSSEEASPKVDFRAPIGQDDEGKAKYVVRPYTPISDPDAKGYFDLLIKVYPQGKMSQHFATLKPGDVLEVKGPIEKLKYSPNMKKHIGMIAGGTGITPMLQVIDAIVKNPDDNTQVSLLYGNVSPDDILLKQKLDILASSHPNIKVFYTVDKPTKNWKGGKGYVSKDMVIKGLPPPGDDALILVCGPPGMMKHISGDKAPDYSQGELDGMLKELGYTKEMVYKF